MTTIAEVAERLAMIYGELLDGADAPEFALDILFTAVADLDLVSGGLPTPIVRALLDGDGLSAWSPQGLSEK
jgi:hypothetical protein